MQVIVEQVNLPERGHVELGIHRSFEIAVSSEDARAKVKRWLWNEVSMLLGAGTPDLVIDERIVWRVPVIFSAPGHGQVGTVGVVEVAVQSGELLHSDVQRAQIEAQANLLADRLPEFQPMMDVHPDSIVDDHLLNPKRNVVRG